MRLDEIKKKVIQWQQSPFLLPITILLAIVVAVESFILFGERYTKEQKLSENISQLEKKLQEKTDQNVRLLIDVQEFALLTSGFNEEIHNISNSLDDLMDLIVNQEVVINSQNKSLFDEKPLTRRVYEKQELRVNVLKLNELNQKITVIHNFFKQYQGIIDSIPSRFPIQTGGEVHQRFGESGKTSSPVKLDSAGIILTNENKAKIVSTAEGKVEMIELDNHNGHLIEIAHKYGYSTLYYPLSRVSIQRGQKVKKGQVIGSISSPNQNYLNYEIHINGQPIDPTPFVQLDLFNIKSNLNQ